MNFRIPARLDIMPKLFFGRFNRPLCLLGTLWLGIGSHPVFSASQLNVAGPGVPVHFDPHAVSDLLTRRFLASTYQALIEPDLMGQLRPALSDRWERVNVHTWRFHLRSGITFPQGEALTADDVIFSFERARRPASPWRPTLTSIKSVRSVNQGRSVEFVLNTVDPSWLRVLSGIKIVGRQCCIQMRHRRIVGELDSSDILRKASYGTGRFQAKRIEVSSNHFAYKVILTPNSGHMTEEGEEPLWERIEYRAISSDDQRFKALAEGRIQVALDMKPRFLDASSTLESMRIPTARLLVMVWPWAMKADRSDMVLAQKHLRDFLKNAELYRGDVVWAKPDAIWNTFWGHSHALKPLPAGSLESSSEAALVPAPSPESPMPTWTMLGITDRGSVYDQFNEILVEALKNKGIPVEVNGVESTAMPGYLASGHAHAALIEWLPYSESSVASLLALISAVCPSMISPGCEELWSAYEKLIRHPVQIAAGASSNKEFEVLDALNNRYGWWMPVTRLMSQHYYQRTVQIVPNYDGSIDFNSILPKSGSNGSLQ